MKAPQTIRVELGQRSYDVRVGAGVLGELGETANRAAARHVVVVSDSNVAPLYGGAAERAVSAAGATCSSIMMPAGEQHKTLRTCEGIFDSLFNLVPAADRQTLVVALGGGVVGDVAGFVAATALRGLRFVQCPTTLLAAVDASVGGKTGVDHAAGKNLIGAFHQPIGVLVDVSTFRTLDRGDVLSGLAECVKHGVIRDADLLDFIEANDEAILACDEAAMAELVCRNVRIKAAVVSTDEREAGQRAHLNFGHTIGHAIETLAGYGGMSHGQAVALGMVAALHVAVSRGLIDAESALRVEALLKRLGLAVRRRGLEAADVWRIMQHDKKNRDGRVRMVLPTRLGQVEVYDDVQATEVAAATEALDE